MLRRIVDEIVVAGDAAYEGAAEQLLEPPSPDETTAHFESLRGA